MSPHQRTALVLCGEKGLSRFIESSAGKIRIETAATVQEAFATLSRSPIDIVALPWAPSSEGYSVARAIRRRYTCIRLVFFDSFANHPLSRHCLDESGFGRAPVISTRVLGGFFQTAMLHILPELFPGDHSPTLFEFTEFDISLLERIASQIESFNAEAAALEVVLDSLLQPLGYGIDLILPIMDGAVTIVAGGKLISAERYLHMLLLLNTTNIEGHAQAEAVSKLLFMRSSNTSKPSCVAITRPPSSGAWKPARSIALYLKPEPRKLLEEWLERAMDLFIRDLALRYFRASRAQPNLPFSEDAFITGNWQVSLIPD